MTSFDTLAFIAVIGVVTFRVVMFAIFDAIFDPVRTPTYRFLQRKGRGRTVRHWLYELISCPICLSVWVAAGAVALTDLVTSVPLPVWVWLGASTISIWTWHHIDPFGERDDE